MSLSLKTRLLLFIDRLDQSDLKTIDPAGLRKKLKKKFKQNQWLLEYSAEKLHSVSDHAVPVEGDTEINVRVYRPVDAHDLPLIIFFHGGGFVQGDADQYDRTVRRLAAFNRAVAVSVEYRLAPESSYPGAPNDCYAATCWAIAKAHEWGADPGKTVVMGDSAGGNLATVVCLMARDRKGPVLRGQVLIYPTLDMTFSLPSHDTYAKGYLLTRELMEWFANHYCGKEEDKKQAYLSPLLAPDLRALPPALVVTAGYDPLRDDGAAYAKRLQEAGVHTIYKDFPSMVHAYFVMPRYFREARETESLVKEFLATLW